MIYRMLKRIYYVFYVWSDRYGNIGQPHLKAMYYLTAALFVNTYSIVLAVWGHSKTWDVGKIPIPLILGWMVALGVLLYFLFVRGGRYLEIRQEFEGDPDERSGARRLARGYILFSVVFLAFAIRMSL